MTKILVYIASSLDGYIAREDGSIDWLPEPSESGMFTSILVGSLGPILILFFIIIYAIKNK